MMKLAEVRIFSGWVFGLQDLINAKKEILQTIQPCLLLSLTVLLASTTTSAVEHLEFFLMTVPLPVNAPHMLTLSIPFWSSIVTHPSLRSAYGGIRTQSHIPLYARCEVHSYYAVVGNHHTLAALDEGRRLGPWTQVLVQDVF